MCGIAGILAQEGSSIDRHRLASMIAVLAHRGPDHQAVHVEPHLGLANARLSIVDLSDRANQPMWDVTGRYAIVFNGEIYNFKELRAELQQKGHSFATQSDTEVILEAYKEWKVDCLSRFNGMWAFALWSRDDKTLLLARDRFGVKPLYVHRSEDGTLLFASEAKSILVAGIRPELDPAAFRAFRAFRGEDSIFAGIETVPPGSYVVYSLHSRPQTVRWWRTIDHLQSPPVEYGDRVDRFRELLFDSVRIRLRTDVAVAASLSGGLDSSSIYVAFQQLRNEGSALAATSACPVDLTPFVMSYPSELIDESEYACALGESFGAQVRKVLSTPDDFRSAVEEAIWYQENPSWNPAVLAYHQLYRAISDAGFKVVLEGHGSDEMLGGYPVFAHAALGEAISRLQFRKGWSAARALARSSNPAIGQSGAPALRHLLVSIARTWLPIRRQPGVGHKEEIFDRALQPDYELKEIWRQEIRHFTRLKQSVYLAFHHEILPTMLRVFDRASMACSLESRAPFLDYRLVTFVLSLPDSDLIGGGWTKRILRDSMKALLPAATLSRPGKLAFLLPQPSWFSQTTVRRALAEAASDGTIDAAEGLNRTAYRRLLEQAAAKGFDWQNTTALWTAYSYAVWYDRFIRSDLSFAAKKSAITAGVFREQ